MLRTPRVGPYHGPSRIASGGGRLDGFGSIVQVRLGRIAKQRGLVFSASTQRSLHSRCAFSDDVMEEQQSGNAVTITDGHPFNASRSQPWLIGHSHKILTWPNGGVTAPCCVCQRCCAHAPSGKDTSDAPSGGRALLLSATRVRPGTGPRPEGGVHVSKVPVPSLPAPVSPPGARWKSTLGKCAGAGPRCACRRWKCNTYTPFFATALYPSLSSSCKAKSTTQANRTIRIENHLSQSRGSRQLCQPAYLLPFLASNSTSRRKHPLRLQHSVRPRSEANATPNNMASLAAAARDIPKAGSSNRDNLAVVADRSGLATVARSHTLPTPPNSISPALPAHGLKAQLQKAKLEPIDSDLDLQDNADGHDRSPSPTAHEASGAITCALLAKYHLPDILLDHGPLAIRHIMGYLTTSVPGFSGIPPTKARRLVVGALEGRGGEGGGLEGDVEFEKVGWGRWDARQRGSAARDRQGTPPSSYGAGIPISKTGGRGQERARANVSGSVGEESIHFSHDDHDMHMMETEADKMSMDGSASASCSEAPDDDVVMNDDPEDVTDDEDWAAMGAAALRADSYPNMAAAQSDGTLRPPNFALPGGLRSFYVSSGMARPPPPPANLDLSLLAGTSDAQEREAVEALLRLGSV
ncbi:Uncharacterized protein TPAR_06603 [Tolypocladium paradoxum]|uniref:Protein STB3 n=1 Tax=Tolypocladium paradoxum TaxID=94208 RepID=A0A2S4KSR3_9HYPO|nr:Uncharacterized protein TPAR_06603 [Tolypocladium paradoxum]